MNDVQCEILGASIENSESADRLRIAMLPGDGVGPEVLHEVRKILIAVGERFGLSFDVRTYPCGGKFYLETGKEWPDVAFEDCRDWADAMLLGAVGHPGARLPNGDLAGAGVIFGLRFGLDLYANVRPCKLFEGVKHKIHDNYTNVWSSDKVDFVIIRENTEGAYAPIRGQLRRGGESELAVDNRVITRKGSTRVIDYAYRIAQVRSGAPLDGKKRLTCVDKSNVMAGCQLFRSIFDEVGSRYPEIERDYVYIDAFTQYMVRTPEQYDVAVTTNMLGDIATDLAAVLQGGMGIAASGNIGDRHGMFEGVHGSAPNIAGQDKANPVASVMSCQMMLEWLGNRKSNPNCMKAALAVERGVRQILAQGQYVTGDMGGNSRCSETGDALAEAVRSVSIGDQT